MNDLNNMNTETLLELRAHMRGASVKALAAGEFVRAEKIDSDLGAINKMLVSRGVNY